MLALAVEAEGQAAAAAAAVLRRRRGQRLTKGGQKFWRRARVSARRKKARAAAQRLAVQVQLHNSCGGARTVDHLMLPPGVSQQRRVPGAGQWKRWTVPAVCKAAFAHAAMTSRGVRAVVGSGSHAQAAKCKDVISSVILEAQRHGVKRLRQEYHACIINNIFDETKLSLRVGRRSGHREYPVLASHGQLTLVGGESVGNVTTEDVIRAPKVLRRATAACTWAALTAPEDLASLDPGRPMLPGVTRRAFLTTTDAAAYNHLALKHLTASLPPGNYHLACDCLQHRTGSVIENITRQLKILNDCFCLAKAWKQADLFQDVQEHVRARVQEGLRVVRTLGDLGETWGPEAAQSAEARRTLLRVAYVQLHAMLDDSLDLPAGAAGAAGQAPASSGQGQGPGRHLRAAEAFLSFFHGSTERELVHVCPGPACGSSPCVSREEPGARVTECVSGLSPGPRRGLKRGAGRQAAAVVLGL